MQRSFSIIDDDDSEDDIIKHGINPKSILTAEGSKSSKDEDNVLLDLGDTDSEENSTSPKRSFPKLAKFSPDHVRNATSSAARPGSKITQDRSRMQTGKQKSLDGQDKLNEFLSESEPEESDNENDEKREPLHVPGEYDYKAYENLEVDDEAKEMFQYIIKKRIRNTSRGESDIMFYKNAYDKVQLGNHFKRALETYGVNYFSLLRYKRNRDLANEDDHEQIQNIILGWDTQHITKFLTKTKSGNLRSTSSVARTYIMVSPQKKYTPQHLNLDYKFKPFIPEFLPAVGDIDAFLKVVPPEKNISSEPFDTEQLQLGLVVLDEPASNQSDPALLHLQLRAASNVSHTNQAIAVVKKIDNVEKNVKIIDKWIKDISDLHKSKSSSFVKYSEPMPDLDDLMQAWPEDVEGHLKEHGFPYPDSDTSLSEYIDTVCGVFGIPLLKNKIESLHLLFCLYAAVKNSQLYQANNAVTEKEQKEENDTDADQLVLE